MSDWKNEDWLRKRYDSIIDAGSTGYLMVSLKIKRLRRVNRVYGSTVGDELLSKIYEIILDWLEQGEYTAHIYGGNFELLIRNTPVEDKIDYNDYSLVPAEISTDEENLIVRITKLVRMIRDIPDERFCGNIFTGCGIFNLPQKPVEFEIAQYNAAVCRSESTENALWNSHFELYGITFHDSHSHIMNLRKNVLPAMENGDFKLYLQPKVELKTGQVTGAEALVRWCDPVRGMIPLSDFLPEMETNGLIAELDMYLFELVCGKIEKWIHELGKKIKISVNLSKFYFYRPGFLADYRNIFEKFDISKDCIEIELLESIVLNNMTRLKEVVDQIREYGFDCALDDFGSGFSSYGILANADISVLKIDRSLFRDASNEKEKNVVSHIVKLAHEIGMTVVAEGIETQSYVKYLSEIGCDYIQGFVFYRPMPVDEFEERFVRNGETVCMDKVNSIYKKEEY